MSSASSGSMNVLGCTAATAVGFVSVCSVVASLVKAVPAKNHSSISGKLKSSIVSLVSADMLSAAS